MKFDINKEIAEKEIMLGYYNGATAYIKNGKLDAVKYNSGDWIWFKEIDGEYIVSQILTDDGLMLEYL